MLPWNFHVKFAKQEMSICRKPSQCGSKISSKIYKIKQTYKMRFHFSKSREKHRHETNYICNGHKLLMNNNNRAPAQYLLSVYKYYFWTLIPQNTLEVMKMEIYSVAIFSSINKTFYYTQTKCFHENLLGKKSKSYCIFERKKFWYKI